MQREEAPATARGIVAEGEGAEEVDAGRACDGVRRRHREETQSELRQVQGEEAVPLDGRSRGEGEEPARVREEAQGKEPAEAQRPGGTVWSGGSTEADGSGGCDGGEEVATGGQRRSIGKDWRKHRDAEGGGVGRACDDEGGGRVTEQMKHKRKVHGAKEVLAEGQWNRGSDDSVERKRKTTTGGRGLREPSSSERKK